MAIPDHLKGCPLFLELFDREVEKVVKYCTVYTFERDDFIVNEGEDGGALLIMLEGEATVQKKTQEGTFKIECLKSGDIFGEMVLVGEHRRTADVVANTRCYVLEILYDDVFRLFKSEPQVFGLLILNLSRLLAKRLRSSTDVIVSLQKGQTQE